MNKKPYAILKYELIETMERGTRQALAFRSVIKALEKFEGKPINKRIETYLKKVLPEYTYHMEKHSFSGSYELKIWGGKIGFDQRVFIRLNEHNLENPVYNQAFVLSYNTPWFLDDTRLAQLQKALDRLPAWVNRRDILLEKEKALEDEMEKFDCKYLFTSR